MQPPYEGNHLNPIPPGRSFCTQYNLISRCGYMIHAHACFELIYFARGNGLVEAADYDGPFGPETLALLGPNLPHTWHTDGFLPHGKKLELTILWFAPQIVRQARALAPELASLSPLLSQSRRGLIFSKPVARRIAPRLMKLRGRDGADALGEIYQILHELQQDDKAQPLAAEHAPSPARREELQRVSEICSYIQQHHAEPLTLDSVADGLELCVSTLNSLLKRYRRETFLQYLTRIRLDHAKEALRRGEGTITDVAFACGFGSLATFNRRFRADQGMSPGEYRDLHVQ